MRTTITRPIELYNPVGLNTSLTLLPAYLKDLGYKTYALGK